MFFLLALGKVSCSVSKWDYDSFMTEGENITCGDVLCSGLCIKYINHSINTDKPIYYGNVSYCYTGDYNLCYKVRYIYILATFIFLIPNFIVYIYISAKKCFLFETMDKFDFGFLFTTIIGPPSIGLTIAGAYCIVAFGNDFDSTGLNMEIVFPCLYAYSMIMGSIYIFVSKPEEGVSYFQFIGAKFCSLSELTDKIAEVRAAPPIFQLNQTIGKGPSSLFKYVEYLTWEETESIISIPSKCPVCVAYKFYTEQSENIKNEVKEISSSNPGISFSSHVDVETPLLIAGNNITPIVKFMTRPFMKVVYIILVIFQYEFLLDLIFFSNCKLLVVKSYKRADVEPLFRTKAGEKDFEAATSMIQNEEAVDKNEDLL